jgi:hypothetical protein
VDRQSQRETVDKMRNLMDDLDRKLVKHAGKLTKLSRKCRELIACYRAHVHRPAAELHPVMHEWLLEFAKFQEKYDLQSLLGPTWSDPVLGTFELREDIGAWVATVRAPAFDRFWDGCGERTTGDYRLWIKGAQAPPSAEAIALAAALLVGQSTLVSTITQALWNDFTGDGPPSGMWWHGDLHQVGRMSCGAPPTGPDDLLRMMVLDDIAVSKMSYYPAHLSEEERETSDEPVAKFVFRAQFEQEHGVGVLTDGIRVLGLGYAGEAVRFALAP